MSYFIAVSDIAAVVDQNPYQDSDDCLRKYQKRFFKTKVETHKEKIKKEVTRQLKSKGINIKTYLKRVDVANSNDLCKELTEVLVPDSDSDPDSDEESKPALQEEIKKYIKSEIYKEHGKKHENLVFEWLKTQLHGTVAESQKGSGKFIGMVGKIPWRIYGKIDGMYTNHLGKKFIIEIKNRQNRLFDKIPLYEQIQIQMYMWIFGVDEAVFVQHYVGTHEIMYFKYDSNLVMRTLKDLMKALTRIQKV